MRRFLVLVALLATFAGTLSLPGAAFAEGPIDGQTPLVVVPPLRSDGPVVLSNGRVLPVEPASVPDSSVQAEMLAAHAGDRIQFTPGAVPREIDTGSATLSLSSASTSRIVPLDLAPASAPSATLAVVGSLPNGLHKEVFGFLPYWLLDAGSLQSMRYDLVSTIAYFGVAAQSDGTLATASGGSATPGWSGWNSSAITGVINAAHARGVRVVLTVTMMAWDGGTGQAALLGSDTARATLVTGIVAAVGNRAADGVNLDFEPVGTPLRDQYTSFVRQLKAALVAAGVGSYLTVDTTAGAATWASGYDLAGLTSAGAADAVFVMGYDYSWSGSARAGAVAPMKASYILDISDSVHDYLATISAGKILWGVPYYGRTWQTTGAELNAPTVAGASGASRAYGYTAARTLAATHGRLWDAVGQVPWFVYYDAANATWVEGYYDDAESLGAKFDMVNEKGFAGAGMWALLMDKGEGALWDLLAAKFQVPVPSASTYVPMAPARLLDSRFGNGLSGKFSANTPRTFQVTGRGGVPVNAVAVTGNFTVTNQTSVGAAFLGPYPSTNPGTSTLNFPVGDNRANGVTMALGAGGSLHATYLAAGGSADFIFDATGYFVPDASGATYVPLAPARLLDSRVGNGLAGQFNANSPRTFQVSGRGGVPANAVAVTGNFTVTNQTAAGAAFLGPSATASPSTSTLNFPVGDSRANGVTLALGSGGSLSATYLAPAGHRTDFVFDVTGYFVPDASGATYVPLAPVRLLDSRVGNGLTGTFGPYSPRTFQVSGRGGVPANAVAVTGNFTVTNQTAAGAAFLGPNPTSSPTTSTLNFPLGDNRANGVTLALGPGGSLSATYLAPAGSTAFIFDVTGYFVAD